MCHMYTNQADLLGGIFLFLFFFLFLPQVDLLCLGENTGLVMTSVTLVVTQVVLL